MITLDFLKEGLYLSKVKWSLYKLLLVLGVILAGCSSGTSTEDVSKEKESVSEIENNEGEAVEEQKSQYYVTANEGGSISKIDSNSNSVVSTIEVDGTVHNVQVAQDG